MNKLHDTQLSRRRFQQSIAGIAAAGCAATLSARAPANQGNWIDAHVHVWTPDIQKYPLAKGFTIDDMQPRSFMPAELFAHARPQGVRRIVLIQMSFYQYDNRYMTDMIAKYPGVFSGVGIVDHHRPDVVDRMRELAKQGVRGFRIHSRGPGAKAWVDDPGIQRLWQAAEQQNLAVCPLINPADIPFIDKLCQAHQGTRVVIDHFARIGISGRIEPDRLEQLCKLARFPNVHVKVSAFYALGEKRPPYLDLAPMIRKLLDAFGPERLMWASDCPFQVQGIHSYADSISLIRDRLTFLSAGDKQALLRTTAEKVFFS